MLLVHVEHFITDEKSVFMVFLMGVVEGFVIEGSGIFLDALEP